MVQFSDEEDRDYADTAISQEMRNLFDEWHFRVLFSGLAIASDRVACFRLASDIFVVCGVQMTEEEKVEY